MSSGDFSEALQAILGEGAGLSAANVVWLKAAWGQEYQQWRRRDLSAQQHVYFWADGIHVNVRLDAERSCILVIMGADEHGNKEWREMLLDMQGEEAMNRSCILVIMGADEHGNKELVGQLHPGDHGCRRARQQGTGGRQRRVSGEHRLLARDAAGQGESDKNSCKEKKQ